MLLDVSHVSISYPARRSGVAGFFGATAPRRVVHDVSFSIDAGETLALVGESGCGKTTLARAILGLVPVECGSIRLGESEVRSPKSESQEAVGSDLRADRTSDLGHGTSDFRAQMVFQDPFASLNPRQTVLDLVTEAAVAHGLCPRGERRERARQLLADVGLQGDILDRYPHAFSGGQRQRLNIARALSLEPSLLVCDEPVSALDVSVQAQVLNLLADLRAARGLAMLFISHDIAVVRHVADRIAVMREGRIVEMGEAAQVLDRPAHPYTQGLLAACLD